MEFALQSAGPYDLLLAGARWGEERGLACFAIPDHYVMSAGGDGGPPAFDALVQLGALARETSRIRLSVLVSPVTIRHPAILAKTGATLDALSGGRFTLGLGTGWLESEHRIFGFDLPSLGDRFDRLEEALAYVRAASSGRGFAGEYYTLEEADLQPRPSEGFALVVGGKGSTRTPTLAGRYADEYNVYPAEPAEMQARIDTARRAADEAGRNPNDLLISSAGAVLVGHDEADYRRRLRDTAEASGATVDELEAHFAFRNTPRGPAAAVRGQLETMAGLGVSRFYLQSGPLDDLDAVGETLDLIAP